MTIQKTAQSLLEKNRFIIFAAIILSICWYCLGTNATLIIVAIMAGIGWLIYSQQHRLLYMPVIPDMSKSPSQNPSPYRNPSEFQLNSSDIQLTTSDNIKIRGWHIHHQNPQRVIVYFHQNAGNIGFRLYLVKQLSLRTNSDVIIVAYRGFSDSEGSPSEEGLQKDAHAVLDYAIDSAQNQKIPLFIYGRSLGGAVTIYVSSHPQYKSQISGVIVENTFTNISDMIDAIMPIFKHIKFLQRNFWPSIQRVSLIQKPILFIRSLRDQLIPTSQMVRLIQSSSPSVYIQQYTISKGTHNTSWELQKDVYFGRLQSFFLNVAKSQ